MLPLRAVGPRDGDSPRIAPGASGAKRREWGKEAGERREVVVGGGDDRLERSGGVGVTRGEEARAFIWAPPHGSGASAKVPEF